MPISGLKDKENIEHTYNRILFSLKKGGNPVVYYSKDELWRQYAK